MAHEYAKVNVAIWGDQDWKQLTRDEHWLYFLLWTHPGTNAAGVADWRPGRLSKHVAATSAEEVRRFGQSLQAKRFLLIDEDTEEVLIRSYLKHDHRMKQPNAAVSVANAYSGTASVRIQTVLVHELQKLQDRHPDFKGFSTRAIKDVLSQKAESIDSYLDPSANPSHDPSVDPSDDTTPDPSVNPSVSDQPNPSVDHPLTETETETPSNEGGLGETSKPKRRAPQTPLPEHLTIKESHRAKAAKHDINLEWEFQKFKDHHQSKDSRFSDWSKAFHTWLNNATDYGHRNGQQQDTETVFNWTPEDWKKWEDERFDRDRPLPRRS